MTEQRVAEIRRRIEAALSPLSLEVIDDSHKHAGHAGARDGRGHFVVRVTSDRFAGLRPLQRHNPGLLHEIIRQVRVTHQRASQASNPTSMRKQGLGVGGHQWVEQD